MCLKFSKRPILLAKESIAKEQSFGKRFSRAFSQLKEDTAYYNLNPVVCQSKKKSRVFERGDSILSIFIYTSHYVYSKLN